MPKATWWAARDGAPARAATAPARRKQASSDAERTKICAPIVASDRIAGHDGRRRSPAPAEQQHRERRAHAELGEDGAGRRSVEAEVEPVDEHELEHDVRGVAGHDDDERRPQVAHAAQPALAGEREQRTRDADDRDPQVARGEPGDLAVPAQRAQRRVRHGGQHRGHRHAEPQREPDRLRPERRRGAVLAGPVQPRHPGGRPVGQEDAEPDDGAQRRRGERERGELRRAQVADDRGVDQEVERLGRERAQRGHGQGQDLAVAARGTHAAPLYDPAMVSPPVAAPRPG